MKGHERKVFRSRRCEINSELEKKGYIVIRGKASRKYFEERIYGMSDAV